MEEELYISVVDVRDYAYCPRVVFFRNVLHVTERTTEAMLYGRESHEEPPLAPLAPRLKPARVIRDVELTSRRLRLTGKVDMVVVTKHGEYVPVEVKWSEPEGRALKRQHKAQMAAYSLLVEDSFNTIVKRAIVYYSRAGRLIQVVLTSQDKRQVEQYVERIYRIIRGEEVPDVRQSPRRCRDCGYRPYCRQGEGVGRSITITA